MFVKKIRKKHVVYLAIVVCFVFLFLMFIDIVICDENIERSSTLDTNKPKFSAARKSVEKEVVKEDICKNMVKPITPLENTSKNNIVQLEIVDTVSQQALPGTVVELCNGNPEKHDGNNVTLANKNGDEGERLISDEKGMVSITASKPADHIRLITTKQFGSKVFVRKIEKIEHQDTKYRIQIPVYAALNINIILDTDILIDGTAFVIPFPDIPSEIANNDIEYEHLISVRIDPSRYLALLRENSIWKKIGYQQPRPEICARVVKNRISILIPYENKVVLSLLLWKLERRDKKKKIYNRRFDYIPERKIVHLKCGEETWLNVRPRRKPVVKGIVLDENGLPVRGIEVTVATRSNFSDIDLFPYSRREPCNPGFIIKSRRGLSVATVVAQITRITDNDGIFSIYAPFTDNVAAWTFKEGFFMAYQETTIPEGRYGDVDNLTLILRPAKETRDYIFIRYSDGSPVVDAEVQFAYTNPSHPFQIKIPALTINKDGKVDTTWIEKGRMCAIIVKTQSKKEVFEPTIARIAQGARYEVKCRKKNQNE
jgi:hypothetical protein